MPGYGVGTYGVETYGGGGAGGLPPTVFFGPVQAGAAYRGITPAGRALFRHYGTVTEGRNVYIMTNGTVTENDPTDLTLVRRVLFGGHYEPVDSAEQALLIAAGYGGYLT